MKIAFLGGTGFIGHTAATEAIKKGHNVFLLHRGKTKNDVHGAKSHIVDRTVTTSILLAIEEIKPDVLIDTRSMTEMDANTVISALKEHPIPVVVLSSQDVYAQFGTILGHPSPLLEEQITEKSRLSVPFPYQGRDHEGGEQYDKKNVEKAYKDACNTFLPSATILRLPATYGWRDQHKRFKPILEALDHGNTKLPCKNSGNWRWTHSHVKDVAHAIILSAEKHDSGFEIFNVGEKNTPTMKKRCEEIAKFLGKTIDWVENDSPLPKELFFLGEMPNNMVVDSTKIRDKLGYSEITTEEERLKDLVKWLRHKQ